MDCNAGIFGPRVLGWHALHHGNNRSHQQVFPQLLP